MINVLINGFEGRMGQMVLKQIECSDIFNCNGGIGKNDDIYQIDTIPDVIIDFSTPTGTLSILRYAEEKNIPVVIATTGFSDKQLQGIKNASTKIPIFKSANMSYELNVLLSLVGKLAEELSDSDIEIVETHHNKKVDSPSGTALMLYEVINNSLGNSMHYEFGRYSKKAPRSKNEIGIHSIRGGTEIGKHSVLFLEDNQTLEITHTVNSRVVFANGALKAAKFLIGQPAGLYNMNDLIALSRNQKYNGGNNNA